MENIISSARDDEQLKYKIDLENKVSALRNLLLGYDEIFIDTCSIMAPDFPKFAAMFALAASNSNLKLIVIDSMLRELRRHFSGETAKGQLADDFTRKMYAGTGILTLSMLAQNMLVEYVSDGSSVTAHADRNFLSLFNERSEKRSLALITQDIKLATDILKINDQQSTHTKRVSVLKIKPVIGILEPIHPGEFKNSQNKSASNGKSDMTAGKVFRRNNDNAPRQQNGAVRRNYDSSASRTTNVVNSSPRSNNASAVKKPAPVQVDNDPLATPARTTNDVNSSPKSNNAPAVKKTAPVQVDNDTFASKDAKSVTGDTLVIPGSYKSVSTIGRTDFVHIIIEEGVECIKPQAFKGCADLTDIQIPDSLTVLSHSAFRGCKSLIEIALKNVTSIETSAFKDCSSLSTVMFGQNLKRISKDAFANCTSLGKIFLSSNVTEIDPSAFSGCPNVVIVAPADSIAIKFALNGSLPYEIQPTGLEKIQPTVVEDIHEDVQSVTSENDSVQEDVQSTVQAEVQVETMTEVPTEAKVDIPTEVPTDVKVDIPTEVPTDVKVDIPTEAQTEAKVDIPTEVPTDVQVDVSTDEQQD